MKYIASLLYQTEVLITSQMDVWLIEMSTTSQSKTSSKGYWMYGSGLIAVPHNRVNEFPRLKAEFHAEEVRKGMMLALARKMA
jgi:hypothetical protein